MKGESNIRDRQTDAVACNIAPPLSLSLVYLESVILYDGQGVAAAAAEEEEEEENPRLR